MLSNYQLPRRVPPQVGAEEMKTLLVMCAGKSAWGTAEKALDTMRAETKVNYAGIFVACSARGEHASQSVDERYSVL